MRILIADTNETFLAAVALALRRAGHKVLTASNGMQAWDYLLATAGRPDILITDIHLGVGSPPGSALGLRARAYQPPLPVIYVPSSPDFAAYADLEHGVVLPQPVAVIDVVNAVKRLSPDREGQ